MICFNVSLAILAAFLLLTLVVGIYFSRRKTTFREYAVGNKQFVTAALVATILATAYSGGGLVRNVEQVHELGLYWIIVSILGDLGLWVVGWLALRMGAFMHNLSMAETIGSVYGTCPRVIVALFSMASSITMVAMQVHVMSLSINMCIQSVNPEIITIFSTLILIFYSSFGGIRAVAFTDVLQFMTFSIILPFLAWLIFAKVGKPFSEIFPLLQEQEKFQFGNLFHCNMSLVAMIALILAILVSYIDAPIVHRVYMSSGPTQARKVFRYAGFFCIFINMIICLIGLLVFAGTSKLPEVKVWDYIIADIPPLFQGLLSVSLLAMSMSTADSCLNSSAVAVSHDMLESIRGAKDLPYPYQLLLARISSVFIGLFAMALTFYYGNLLDLLMLNLGLYVPITVAPFILSVFGFRGTSRTALIGMATGVLTILAWNKWVELSTDIDGSFVAMLANGLAMMAAHYLLKQPKDAGWVAPDDTFKQMQQADARKRAERKEAIKNGWANRKTTMTKLTPSDATVRLTGLYMIITAILSYLFIRPDHIYWAICQALVGVLFTASKTFFSKRSRGWLMGLSWFIGIAVYLPLNLLGHWCHLVDPMFTASLSLAHCAVILWVLPLYLGISVVVGALLVAIYPISVSLTFPIFCSLLPLFVVSLLLFTTIICLKSQLNLYKKKTLYLENQENARASRKLKASLYDSSIVPGSMGSKSKGYGAILAQVVSKIEESISFLDSNIPLYKQDFQSIIHKLYDWVAYFNKSERAKKHALLQPTKITIDKLIRKVELALSQEVADPPKLLVEKVNNPNGALCPHIVCDIHQVVYLLVKAILHIGKLEGFHTPVVKIQLHPTALQFKQVDPLGSSHPVCMLFQATAFVLSQATTAPERLPKVKELYDDVIDVMGPAKQQVAAPSIALQQATISTIVSAHYGYLEYIIDQQQPTMLLVLPNNVTDILSKMTTKLPIDYLTSETPVSTKEQADSMMALMQFHDYVCKSSHKEDPIHVGTISSLLLLLRQHFGFKRHASGQLFYVRTIGIAELVVDWVFHSPKVIYAALLYELVRHTCLPLSYVKEHYNLGVYAFVLNVVGIDKRQDLDHPSLLYVQNRLKEAIKEEHVQLSVLFIKLAERLYDLRHAAGYIHLTEVQHLAQETLAIDVPLAHTYLDPEIGTALEQAAKQALEDLQR